MGSVFYFQAWVLPWSVVDTLSVTLLEEIDFHFTSTYQLQTGSWLGVGFVPTFP